MKKRRLAVVLFLMCIWISGITISAAEAGNIFRGNVAVETEAGDDLNVELETGTEEIMEDTGGEEEAATESDSEAEEPGTETESTEEAEGENETGSVVESTGEEETESIEEPTMDEEGTESVVESAGEEGTESVEEPMVDEGGTESVVESAGEEGTESVEEPTDMEGTESIADPEGERETESAAELEGTEELEIEVETESPEEQTSMETEESDEEEVVNRMICAVADGYRGVYSEEDIRAHFAYQEEELVGANENATICGSYEEAVEYLKGRMKARQETVSFQVKSGISEGLGEKIYNDALSNALLEEVMKENSNTPADEGDYIRANFIGYRVAVSSGWDYVAVTYNFIFTSNADQESQVNARISSVMSSLNLEGKSSYEKLRAIHDYIVNHIDYRDDGTYLCHSTYAALIKGECVCQGYASLFQRMSKLAGFQTRYITGTADGEGHAWNIVKLGNVWYNVDVTWDDPIGGNLRHDYFLKSDLDFSDHSRDKQYRTDEFYEQYPMASVSYVEGQTVPEEEETGGENGGEDTEDGWPFSDVDVVPGSWRYDSVKYVYENNIMNGITESDGTINTFEPDSPLTRAMFVTVLYRMAGSPAVTWKNTFSDVPAGRYFSNAVIWANENNIVEGFKDGRYGVDDDITREQIAKMLMEYAKLQGYATAERASLTSFPDQDKISGWATDYMRWAVGVGMINGKNIKGVYYLDPKGAASRVECAAMLTRFLNKYQ